MNDSYKEILIKRNTPVGNKILKGLLIALAAISIFIGLVFWPLLIVGAVLVVVCWLFVPKLEVEYEYLYVNGELDIDAIYSKQKRKKMGSYDASELEILAPENSHELDSFRNRKDIKVHDYSSLEENAKTFGMAINGDKGMELIYFDPNEAIIKDMQRIAPRSVKLY